MALTGDSDSTDTSPSDQTPPLNPDIIGKARKALDLAASEEHQQVALGQIQQLCDEHDNIGLLYQIQSQILENCYDNTTEVHSKEKYLEDAIKCCRRSNQLSPNSIYFSSSLGYLLYRGSTDSNDYIEAIQQYNKALNISDPNDPALESIHAEVHSTYEARIEYIRQDILKYVGLCVYKLKELHTDSSIIKHNLQSLKLNNEEKVKLYWISLSIDEKLSFLQVDVDDLINHLFPKKENYLEVFLDALSFLEAHKKLDFYGCSSCNKIFPTSAVHFHHVSTVHLNKLFRKLRRLFYVSVSDWESIIMKKKAWMPLDIAAAIEMLEMKWKLLPSALKKSSNDKKQPSIWGKPRCKFELLENEVNPWANREIFKWSWRLSRDFKRRALLSKIQNKLQELKSRKCLLPVHVDMLTQLAMHKLDNLFGSWLRDLGLHQTHYCLRLLCASDLEEILIFVQKMADVTVETFERESIIEESLGSAFKINGVISLSSDSMYLYLDEHSLRNETTSSSSEYIDGNASKTFVPNNIDNGTLSPNVNDLITWIYSGISSNKGLSEWNNLRNERRCRGKEELVKYEKRLSEGLKKIQDFQKGLSEFVGHQICLSYIAKKIQGFQEGLSLDVDSSLDKDVDFALHKNARMFNNDDKWILELAVDVRHLEIKVNNFADYNYQPILLSIVKSYIRERLEGIMEKGHHEEI